ncbi:MAG: esterase/lipase family protein, partial [Micromonosporaceae bacterium]
GSAAPAHAAGHDPIVFVHGFWGDDWNWDVMTDRFRADGWSDNELLVWDYDTSQSNETTARQLSAFVDGVLSETGAAKIDFVTHSMGGLSSRHYIKFLGGGGQVDEWVSLGGPNHGTNAAYACFDASCRDMRYDSTFLTTLNSGDETPGAVRYGTVRSRCDEVINPDTSTVLAGADNRELSDCVGHISLLGSSETYRTVRDFVR